MRKFTFSFKSLLVACLLMGGANAWGDGVKRVLEHQDYENANVTDWHSKNGTISRATGDATYGAYTNFAWQSGDGNNRSAYKQIAEISGTGFTTKEMSTKGYNVEFDISLKSGNKEKKSESQFVVVSTQSYNITANSVYSGTDYLFSLSMGQFTGDGYKTTWYINDLANSTGTTKTLEYTKWYHVKLVVTATSVAYTITDNSTSTVVHSASKTVTSMPTMKGFYSLNAYGGAFMKFDNLEIYDYSSLPAMTKLWGQDYRIITKEQKNMEAAEGEATCSNAISAGEDYYWVPSLNGTSAAANANVGFYCKNSNGRQWRVANLSSGNCYQGIANVSSSSTVHIYNLKKGQIVKVGGFDEDASALYNGAGVLTALTNYDNGAVRFYEVNANGTGELTISSTWAYVYFVEVFEPDYEIVGAMDFTTPYWNKWNVTPVWINAGETGYFKIRNHNKGVNTYENWYLYAANESSENKTVLRADKHVNIGSGTLVWEDYKEGTVVADLSDATVDISVSLADAGDGTYTLTSTAIVTKADGTEMSPYIYTQTGYTENKLKLYVSVEKSWLEVLAQGTIVNEALNTNMSGYKTFYNAISNYKVDANTTIYKAAEPSAGKVVLTEVDGDVIKAGQPVILHTSEATIEITPTDATSTGDYTGNALQVAKGTEVNKYVLGYTALKGFGFYYYEATLPAGYIYLDGAPYSGVKVFSVVTDGTATGVEAPVAAETAEEDGVLYNTAGQIVTKDYKGIVIKNGKKYLNK